MRKTCTFGTRAVPAFAVISALACASAARATDVAVCTDRGRITIQLLDDEAPKQVSNFLTYADQGFYSNTVFHRVVHDFVIQGGGYDTELQLKPTRDPVENESRGGAKNLRGTVAAARTDDPDSATSQFFINLKDNSALDASRRKPGYTVFGRVTDGMSVVNEIGQIPTGAGGPLPRDVPDPLVAVHSIARIDHEKLDSLAGTDAEEAIKQHISAALDGGNDAEAFDWITQYRAVCGTMDPELLISEARAAAALDRNQRARSALEEYFAATDETHEGYADALALYREVVPNSPESELAGAAVTVARLAGQCDAPSAPALPDGATATIDEMVEAQTAVRSYMADGNKYLECLNGVMDNSDMSDEEHALLVQEYNTTVGRMETVAASFNEQVRIVKSRQ
jgi:cyclophilin family peptidyl-prolyl cis-trans isomerase